MIWLPRIIALLFVGLLVLLSMDSFAGDRSVGEKMLGFLIHLIPAFAVVICLLVAWKFRVLGGLLFIVMGLIFTIFFGTYRSIPSFFSISLPLLLAGILFMISQWWVAGGNTSVN